MTGVWISCFHLKLNKILFALSYATMKIEDLELLYWLNVMESQVEIQTTLTPKINFGQTCNSDF